MEARKAWQDKESARRKLVAAWGVRGLRIADSALQAAREVCEEIPDYLDGQRQKFAGYYRLRDLLAKARREMESAAKLSGSLPPWESMPDVPDAAARLAAAYADLLPQLALLGPSERHPGAPSRQNVRARMLSFVYRADPEFKATATEWAYFGIASGLDDVPESSDEFRDEWKPVWKEALKRGRAEAAAKPLPEASRLDLLHDLAGEAWS